MNATNPQARELLDRAFTLACSAAQIGRDSDQLQKAGRNGDFWQMHDLAASVNRASFALMTQAARIETYREPAKEAA